MSAPTEVWMMTSECWDVEMIGLYATEDVAIEAARKCWPELEWMHDADARIYSAEIALPPDRITAVSGRPIVFRIEPVHVETSVPTDCP